MSVAVVVPAWTLFNQPLRVSYQCLAAAPRRT